MGQSKSVFIFELTDTSTLVMLSLKDIFLAIHKWYREKVLCFYLEIRKLISTEVEAFSWNICVFLLGQLEVDKEKLFECIKWRQTYPIYIFSLPQSKHLAMRQVTYPEGGAHYLFGAAYGGIHFVHRLWGQKAHDYHVTEYANARIRAPIWKTYPGNVLTTGYACQYM